MTDNLPAPAPEPTGEVILSQRLREHLVKGLTMDDARLKRAGGGSHFEELLARIRDIRSSERVFWRKVLDIYAISIDYDPEFLGETDGQKN